VAGVSCSSSDSGGATPAGDAGDNGASTAGKPSGSSGGADTSSAGAPPVDSGDGGTAPVGPSSGGSGTVSEAAGSGGDSTGAAGEGGDAGAGGATVVVVDPNAAAIGRAKSLISSLSHDRSCPTCHQPDFSGYSYWPNITPDEDTGIGTWTDPQIKTAITKGQGLSGKVLCSAMEHFPFSDAQVADLITYLHSLKPVSHKITGICPGD
jgi:hypothetical protein